MSVFFFFAFVGGVIVTYLAIGALVWIIGCAQDRQNRTLVFLAISMIGWPLILTLEAADHRSDGRWDRRGEE